MTTSSASETDADAFSSTRMNMNVLTSSSPSTMPPFSNAAAATSVINAPDNSNSNGNGNGNDKDSERPVWSSRLIFVTSFLSLQVSQCWRGTGLVGGPHNYSFYVTFLCLVLCLAVIGLPLLILEVGVGQTYSIGGVAMWQLPPYCRGVGGNGIWSRSKRPWTGLGVAGIVLGWIVASYSIGILAWTCHALWKVNGSDIIFNQNGNNGLGSSAASDDGILEGLVANTGKFQRPPNDQFFRAYFVNEIIGQSSLDVDDPVPTRLVGANALFCGVLWMIVFWVTAMGDGVHLLGRTNLVLTSLSLILLTVLCVGSLMVPLPSASYISVLTNDDDNNLFGPYSKPYNDFTAAIDQADVLSQSMIQALYITGIMIGCLTSYASYAPSNKEPTARIAIGVVLANIVLIAATGYSVSRALGRASFITGAYETFLEGDSDGTDNTTNDILPVILDSLSTTLFVVLVQWPAALATLPNGLVWARILYSVFVLAGIQFPMAVIIAIATVLREDSASDLSRWKIAGVASALGFAASLLFATDAGLIFLDTIDYYLSLALILLGFLEAFAAGWIYDLDEQVNTYGARAIIAHMLWNFAPVLTAAVIWFGYENTGQADAYHLWLGLFGAVLTFLFFFMCAFLFVRCSYERYFTRVISSNSNDEVILDPRSYYMEFCFGNTESMKRSLESSIGPLPLIWYIFIKRVVPHLLLLVFIKRILLPSDPYSTSIAFGNYGGYPKRPFQFTGIIVFAWIVGLFLLGFVIPNVYSPLSAPPTSVFMNRRDTWEDLEDTVEEATSDEEDETIRVTVANSTIVELDHMHEPIDFENDDDETDSIITSRQDQDEHPIFAEVQDVQA